MNHQRFRLGSVPTEISNNKNTRGVQPFQHSDKGLSLTAKQTLGIPQQGVCPGSVPNRGGWRKSVPHYWGLSPTEIMRLLGRIRQTP